MISHSKQMSSKYITPLTKLIILWLVLTNFLLLIANYEDPWQGNCRGDYKMVYHSLQGNIYANVAELDMNKEHGRLSFYY